MYVGYDDSFPGVKVTVKFRGQCQMYVLLLRPVILIDAAVVGFHCNVTSCGLALVKAEPSSRGEVRRVWAW